MLVAGIVNPPPVTTPGYTGVYFSDRDDMEGKAKALGGKPLRVEHNGSTQVGRVLQGWTDRSTGAMWALAEIDTSDMPGAVAAAAVEHGRFGEFSLGYACQFSRNPLTNRVEAGDKRIMELSIVKTGARPNCTIAAHAPIINKKARVPH